MNITMIWDFYHLAAALQSIDVLLVSCWEGQCQFFFAIYSKGVGVITFPVSDLISKSISFQCTWHGAKNWQKAATFSLLRPLFGPVCVESNLKIVVFYFHWVQPQSKMMNGCSNLIPCRRFSTQCTVDCFLDFCFTAQNMLRLNCQP